MAITSVGYAGTITDANWRRMATAAVGALYGVDDYASWAVTPAVGDRAIQIAPGGGFGLGVRDVSDAPVVKSLASVPSGDRWDLLVAHRNWSSKATTFEVIQGTAVMALPARDTGFGNTNDQPLYLLRVTAGQSTVQEFIDLRCIPGDGGLLAFHDLARSYLDRVGTSVRIGNIVWDRTLTSTGSPEWLHSSARRFAEVHATGPSTAGGGDFTKFSFDAPNSVRTSDEFYTENGVYLLFRNPGIYRVRGEMYVPSGSGVVGFWLRPGNGGASGRVKAKYVASSPGFGQIAEFEIPVRRFGSNGGIAMTNDTGLASIGHQGDSTYLYAEWLGA